MNKNQERVRMLMKMFGQPVRDVPTLPSKEELKNRLKLSLEELLETVEACGFKLVPKNSVECVHGMESDAIFSLDLEETDCNPDYVGIVDGLTDMQVVNDGFALTIGLDMDRSLEIVNTNNLLKVWSREQVDNCEEIKRGDYLATTEDGGTSYIVKNKSGKGMKPPGFMKPDLSILVTDYWFTQEYADGFTNRGDYKNLVFIPSVNPVSGENGFFVKNKITHKFVEK